MKALTCRDPWGELLICRRKGWENRRRNVASDSMVGEVVAIHQGLEWSPLATGELAPDGQPWPTNHRRGMVLGLLEVLEVCGPDEHLDDPFRMAGWWGIRMRPVLVLRTPIPAVGKVGWWLLPPTIEDAIETQRTRRR